LKEVVLRLKFLTLIRSPCSLLVLDSLENLLGYSAINSPSDDDDGISAVPQRIQYSNTILQALKVFCRKQPPPGRRLFILGTCENFGAIKLLGLEKLFDKKLLAPLVPLGNSKQPIQEVLLAIEQDRATLSPEDFEKKLQSYGPGFDRLASFKTFDEKPTKKNKQETVDDDESVL
jgi:hypothetical protein